MADFRRACAVADVPKDGAHKVIVAGTPVSVVQSDGEFFAIYDTCSHQDVSLSDGEVEDGLIECWLHGSQFDLRTGMPVGLPATVPVPVYPLRVEGEDVLVAIDHPLAPETSLKEKA